MRYSITMRHVTWLLVMPHHPPRAQDGHDKRGCCVQEATRVILILYGTFLSGVGPLWFPIDCFCIRNRSFLSTCGACLKLNEEQPISWSSEGQTHFSTSWHSRMSLTLNELTLECSLFKQPTMHEKLPDMEGIRVILALKKLCFGRECWSTFEILWYVRSVPSGVGALNFSKMKERRLTLAI